MEYLLIFEGFTSMFNVQCSMLGERISISNVRSCQLRVSLNNLLLRRVQSHFAIFSSQKKKCPVPHTLIVVWFLEQKKSGLDQRYVQNTVVLIMSNSYSS